MRGWWREIAALVLPTECAGCGRGRDGVCGACVAELRAGRARRVLPVPAPAGLPPVWAAAPYADAVRGMLLAHKERGMLPLARPLGAALGHAVLASGAVRPGGGAGWALVPVPSSRGAVVRRGHDPTRRIASRAAGALRAGGVPARVVPALRLVRPVADQAGLPGWARAENLAGALAVRPGALAAGAPVVLVDDVVTTGASLAEAARAVRAGGARPVAAAVVAGPLSAWVGRTRG
ncbi:Predicted amidophosphoribosyltransferases [Streptomyces zhaozhouensis]|uniref:Predicted amidophosphoribosyltransferases n=1 Tax=Streptomyces zhaozhouensis TaxID=1300267 RepID=A0A286E217_9ACTN|nr:phosphoribosyltransferase family protein [Streptomyces zhaozhouensis]SOD64931.1 Predicted amidophosphoribosyltransferases [Streptomyces zhaozhouensis]